MGKLELFDDGHDGENLPEQLKVNQSFADRFEVCFFFLPTLFLFQDEKLTLLLFSIR
jgi:hypothetical protein